MDLKFQVNLIGSCFVFLVCSVTSHGIEIVSIDRKEGSCSSHQVFTSRHEYLIHSHFYLAQTSRAFKARLGYVNAKRQTGTWMLGTFVSRPDQNFYFILTDLHES